LIVDVSLGTAQSNQVQPQQWLPAVEIQPAWEMVSQKGPIMTVYVSPDGLRDRTFTALVLDRVVPESKSSGHVEVMLFDDRAQTPRTLPASPSQLLHLRARYVRDASGERFVWVKARPQSGSTPKLEETEDSIRPATAG
jgi:hypothetical protein